MNKRIAAIVIALAGIACWLFLPLQSVGPLHRTGLNIGDLTYVLVALPALFAGFSWMKHTQLALLSALAYVAATGYFGYVYINHIGLGLIGIAVCSILAVFSQRLK